MNERILLEDACFGWSEGGVRQQKDAKGLTGGHLPRMERELC